MLYGSTQKTFTILKLSSIIDNAKQTYSRIYSFAEWISKYIAGDLIFIFLKNVGRWWFGGQTKDTIKATLQSTL